MKEEPRSYTWRREYVFHDKTKYLFKVPESNTRCSSGLSGVEWKYIDLKCVNNIPFVWKNEELSEDERNWEICRVGHCGEGVSAGDLIISRRVDHVLTRLPSFDRTPIVYPCIPCLLSFWWFSLYPLDLEDDVQCSRIRQQDNFDGACQMDFACLVSDDLYFCLLWTFWPVAVSRQY